jgi:hypothetical protein
MQERIQQPGAQFAALRSAADKTTAFGIDPSRVFGILVGGGRYSMWEPDWPVVDDYHWAKCVPMLFCVGAGDGYCISRRRLA